jgi:hypothetical protein
LIHGRVKWHLWLRKRLSDTTPHTSSRTFITLSPDVVCCP